MIKDLKTVKIDSALILNCWSESNNLANYHQVKVFWVPSRTGVTGNEREDELAKLGTTMETMETIGTKPKVVIPESRIKRIIKEIREE